jgi:hypothetical protein
MSLWGGNQALTGLEMYGEWFLHSLILMCNVSSHRDVLQEKFLSFEFLFGVLLLHNVIALVTFIHHLSVPKISSRWCEACRCAGVRKDV